MKLPDFSLPDQSLSSGSNNLELKESILDVIKKMAAILTDVARSVNLGTEGIDCFPNCKIQSYDIILAS